MAGYYNRHDVFHVSVNRSRQKPLHDISHRASNNLTPIASMELDKSSHSTN
jgi:hypothetical protein